MTKTLLRRCTKIVQSLTEQDTELLEKYPHLSNYFGERVARDQIMQSFCTFLWRCYYRQYPGDCEAVLNVVNCHVAFFGIASEICDFALKRNRILNFKQFERICLNTKVEKFFHEPIVIS